MGERYAENQVSISAVRNWLLIITGLDRLSPPLCIHVDYLAVPACGLHDIGDVSITVLIAVTILSGGGARLQSDLRLASAKRVTL